MDLEKKSDIKKIILKNVNKAYEINYEEKDTEQNILNECEYAIKNNFSVVILKISKKYIKDVINVSRKIRQLCSIYKIFFLVLSRADIARVIDADGIIITEFDMDINDYRKILDKDNIFAYVTKDINVNIDNCKFDLIFKKNNNIYEIIRN